VPCDTHVCLWQPVITTFGNTWLTFPGYNQVRFFDAAMPTAQDQHSGLLDAAERYAEDLGWWLIPVRGKKPIWDGWPDYRPPLETLRKQLRADASLGIGLNLGGSGLIDLEADTPEGEMILDDLCEGVDFPFWKSQKSRHRLFQDHPDVGYLQVEALKIEFRAGRHQSVLPPSPHPSGVCGYQWVISAFQVPVPPLPNHIVDYYQERVKAPGNQAEQKARGPKEPAFPYRDDMDYVLRHYDLLAEAEKAGVRFVVRDPDNNGNLPCHVPAQLRGGRPDRHPSGVFNVRNGVLRDFATGKNHLFFNTLAALTGEPWLDIFKRYEKKAGAQNGHPHSRRIAFPTPTALTDGVTSLDEARGALTSYFDGQLRRSPRPKTLHLVKGRPGIGKTYGICKSPLPQVVSAVAKEPKEKHLIILPGLTRRFRTSDTLQRLKHALYALYPKERVLDLVSRGMQRESKSLLYNEPEAFDVVIACRLFDEGTDWVRCTRLHNTDAGEGSLTLAVQRFFRPLRRHPEKKSVRIYNYIPAFSPEMTAHERRAVLSDRFNAVLACIVTQGELVPCRVKTRVRLSAAKRTNSNRRTLALEWVGVEHIREHGFDKVWQKQGAFPSALCWGTDKITPGTFRNLLGALKPVPTRKQIRRAIREYYERTGQRIAVTSQTRSEPFEELGRSIQATDHICRRYYGTSLAKEVVSVLGTSSALEQAHAVIRHYWKRGIVINRKTGDLPGIGMSALTLDNRLRFHHNTTLRKEVERLLGRQEKPLILSTVKEVIASYIKRGETFRRRHFRIPELDMSNSNLRLRLRRDFGV